MPFKLRNSDRVKLNKLIDDVKTLSDTVDELREEINSFKVCFIDPTKVSCKTKNCEKLRDGRDKICTNTLQRLKKFLEKNVIPHIPIDTGYHRVKKKWRQIFSQSSRTLVTSSTLCKKRDCKINESCQTSKYDVTKIAKPSIKEEKLSISTRNCRSNVCNNYLKKNTKISSSSSSKSTIKCRDKTLKKSRCSYEFSEASKSLKNPEKKKKNEATVTSDLTRRLAGDTTIEKIENKSPPSVKHLRSTNFMDNEKKFVATEAEESSRSSGLLTSNTSLCDVWNCKIPYKEAKRNYNETKTPKSGSNGKKSRSSQCSSEYKNEERPESYPRDVSTNTIFHDLRQKKICKIILREDRLTSRDTQTCTRSDENFQDLCFDARERYCPESTKKWLRDASSTSLTSSSPRSNAISSLEMKKFGQESGQGIRKNYREKVKFDIKRGNEETGEKKNIAKEANVASSMEGEKKIDERISKPRSDDDLPKNRKKRTYVISSDIPSAKIDPTARHNLREKRKDFSSVIGDSQFEEKNDASSSCRKALKKPEVTSRVIEEQNLRGKICPSFTKQREDRYLRKNVCANRSTNKYLPKFPRWSRKKSTMRSNEKIIRPRVRVYTSSSSHELSDDSCSLISDSNLCHKSRGCSTNVKYPRNNLTEEKSKNNVRVCFSRKKDVTNYSVCGSLSGSARSISCES